MGLDIGPHLYDVMRAELATVDVEPLPRAKVPARSDVDEERERSTPAGTGPAVERAHALPA